MLQPAARLAMVAAAVFALNLPFGWWRAGVRKFSRSWFLAVHAPVPLVIALRLLSGLGFRLSTIPVLVAAFFAGQLAGGRLRQAFGRPGDGGGGGSVPREPPA